MSLSLDTRYAVQLISRTPLVSTIIILTLALCIGANTAIFSVVDATLLRPLPYPEPDRLVLGDMVVLRLSGQRYFTTEQATLPDLGDGGGGETLLG